MSSSSSKRNVSLATINNWKKDFLWLIIELESNLLSGLFCKVCLKYEGKLKVFGGYDGEFVSHNSSHSELFCQEGVLKNFAKFTGKHLCQRPFFQKEFLAQMFSCEFCKISENTFFTEHLRTTASDFIYDTKSQSVKFL